MNRGIKYLIVLTMLFLLFPSCHFMKKKEELSKLGSSKRGIASVTPSFVFVRIPAGSFTMGSPVRERGRHSNEKQVLVEISRPFEIMTTEVTQAQYVMVMGKNPSAFKGTEYCNNYDSVKDMCPDHPVEQVSWHGVQAFIKKLNQLKGLKDCYGRPSDRKGCYRLPTEAEWEYSARAGTTTAYFFGDMFQIGDYAVYKENSRRQTQRVGSKSPNPWGLYDMSGNVSEWVRDVYTIRLPGEKDPLVTYSYSSRRVFRGGSWDNDPRNLRSADRLGVKRSRRYDDVGFRLVRTL